ncbi:MAG: flavodoxin-dependent (E)-4-hydroxy-3-methylbut-2-enyl-diphosphate synthase [Treponema sp.]|jgi:(E)-4-hydroxy-3-methylbut-2-enyl-diphosphate synthase|nr:flavodoxin-dependent (E)-4-hydroxy-3-methylbut-2-enyl-diphosphate synthase [Treponema sp.]
MEHRITQVVKIKDLKIGGNNPVVVQTMWKDRLSGGDLTKTIVKIDALAAMGCGVLRFAVPDLTTAEVLGELAQTVSMPLTADIHFDYKIALRCMDFPIAKIRINPGNIGGKDKTRALLEKASANNIPIRIGVNAGSLPADLREKADIKPAMALVKAAEREVSIFKEFGFTQYMVSMKASGIADTIEANRIFSERSDVPLHLGVTEAGPLAAGVAASTAALATLLKEGIGDTIRVSLSDTMENEIIAGREIIRAAAEMADSQAVRQNRLKVSGVKIVSCPRCGRYGFDTHGFTNRWMPKLYAMNKDITVAVMGCEVNGPVEAKNADLGITGAGDKVLIFRQGKIIKTISADEADFAFEEELSKL